MTGWLIALALALLAALAVFLIAPARAHRANAWRGTAFAHRGLHGDGAEENTLEAFERACCAGYGIELDVQLSRDGEVVVFHDDSLRRMTGDARRVDQLDWAQLRALRVGAGGRIPLLSEVLAQVDGRVPLLVELKNGRRNRALCAATLAQLREYRGAYMIESFNPLMLRWFRRRAPEVLRGQLVASAPVYIAVRAGHAGRVSALAAGAELPRAARFRRLRGRRGALLRAPRAARAVPHGAGGVDGARRGDLPELPAARRDADLRGLSAARGSAGAVSGRRAGETQRLRLRGFALRAQ